MSFDLGMIFADLASAVAVALILIILRRLSEYDRRIQRIEGDLYLAEGNPTSMPLTMQVHNLQQDVRTINETCEKLHTTIESINTTILDCLPLPKKNKKKGGK
jgi:methyl-accepting chemotaxis protein